jgi:histidyl-tRNA synthetase
VGIAVDLAYGERGLKGSMKAADRSQAPLVVIIGDDEVASQTVAVKDMASGVQEAVALTDVVVDLGAKLGSIAATTNRADEARKD